GDVVVPDRTAGEQQRAAAWREQARDRADEAALAGAVGADDAPELAGRHDPVEGSEQAPAVRRVHHGVAPVDQGGAGHHCNARLRTSSARDRKSTRLNSSHVKISYAVFCLKKKKTD